MKKYVICKTGEPVNIGDTLRKKKEVTTTFGKMYYTNDILVTEDIIPELVEQGIIKEVVEKKENKKSKAKEFTLVDVIDMLALKYKKYPEEVVKWLDDTNELCSRAVFDILLQEIAIMFYNNNPKAFDEAKDYYSIRIKDGKVGKVKVISSYIPLFKSVEDAEKAREILHTQLEYMYGKQN